MRTLQVHASKKYDIVIGPELIYAAAMYTGPLELGKAAAIVTDDNVAPLYCQQLTDSLSSAGFRVVHFILPNGEASKNAENYFALLNFLATERFTRSDTIFALGGGVVGDLAAFAASTYMRGMRLIQLPTTLLSAVDSSVGGKTAIDLPAGKNLAGTFYQPDLVLCDTQALDSLPDAVFSDGIAEVIKYGIIADSDLFDSLNSPLKPQLEAIISRCVDIKRTVVEIDETETGPRKLLNFGHTVGHAIEACSNFAVSHGRAVAIGMVIVARACSKLQLCPLETAQDTVAMLEQYGLPTSTEFSPAALAAAALSDKKRSGGSITLVIPERIGKCILRETPIQDLEEFIRLGL